MKCFVLLAVLAFASKIEDYIKSAASNSGENIMENAMENPIVVKIEEDEYAKKKSKSSEYIGVHYDQRAREWAARRWSKEEKKLFTNGTYKDEKTAARASDTLARKLLAKSEQNHKLNFPDDKTEVYRPEKKTKSSEYFGVYYNASDKRWVAYRWSKEEKKHFTNGYHKDEETAAHASDNLARKLMAKGEQNYTLNFPDDSFEVEKKSKSSKYFGVAYMEKRNRWVAQRWSKTEQKLFKNGYHKVEETAARASDTLARKFMANGEQNLKLNFPDDNTDVEKTKSKKYFGVTYIGKSKRWLAQRWGKTKTERKLFTNGNHRDEKTAAHASDTLARKLMANGEQNLTLNFPDDNTEVNAKRYQIKKRKRSFDFDAQSDQNDFEKFEQK